MTVTDIVTALLTAFFLLRGFSRGFMQSILGPFSIIAATIVSIIYYKITKDPIVSLLIGVVGPLLLTFLLRFLLKSWATATHTGKPNAISRLGGAGLTLVWGWVFIVFTLVLLVIIPTWSKPLTTLHNDILKSKSYSIAKPLGDLFFTTPQLNIASAITTPSNSNAQSLAEDPRFQKVLKDPDIQKEIEDHDIMRLMSNPKMMELTKQIMNDPVAMKKVMAIYSSEKKPQIPASP